MSVRNQTPGMDYGPVDGDLKAQFDAEFETDDIDHQIATETAPTCTASCCTGSFDSC